MIQLNPSDRRPLYEQIKGKIKELIISGILKEDDKVPSVRELASMLAINPNTIQKAYKELENDGFIYSKPSKGNFVSSINAIQNNGSAKNDAYKSLNQVLTELHFLGVTKEELLDKINKNY